MAQFADHDVLHQFYKAVIQNTLSFVLINVFGNNQDV